MPMQGSLLADESASYQRRPGEDWFFALLPPESAAAEVAALAHELRRTHGLKSKPFDLWRYHVSLQGLASQPIEPVRWQAEEFVLIQRPVAGIPYEVHERWPLHP